MLNVYFGVCVGVCGCTCNCLQTVFTSNREHGLHTNDFILTQITSRGTALQGLAIADGTRERDSQRETASMCPCVVAIPVVGVCVHEAVQ